MPTHYYAPGDMFGSRIVDRKSAVPGLSSQLIQRLKELRELMVVLALIEATPQPKSGQVADRARLRALGLDLPFEPGILAQIDALSREESDRVYELFSTDRDAAYHLVSFIDMMLSLFQQTDSPINGAVLAFYEQREWRLIHHMREGQEWYCLAGQPLFRDRNAIHRQPEIAELRKLCDRFAHEPRSEDYFEHCWLLEEVDGEEVHAYIDCIVAPSSALASVRDLARREGCRAEIIAAEELGFRGSSAQPRGWRGWRPAAPRR
jgi:hypothetical protein